MPDSISPHGDTLIIDMIRRFSQDRLAPLAAERERQKRIEPEIIAELGELGVFGATTPAEWDGSEIDPVTYALLLEEIAAGRRIGLHHGVGAQFADLHRGQQLRHRRPEGPLAAQAGDRGACRLVRADRTAGGVGCVEPEDPGGEEGRPICHQRRQAVHQQCRASGQPGVLRRHRSRAPGRRDCRRS